MLAGEVKQTVVQGRGILLSGEVLQSPQHARWRSCGRELFYVAVVALCVHAVVRQQVQGPVCGTWAAAQPPALTQSTSKGAPCGALAGCRAASSWLYQVLCGQLWHAGAGAKSAGMGTVSWATGKALGFLWRPLLLAWMYSDLHYVIHLVVATILGAAVIWPSLRRQRVTRHTRAAARSAARLTFLASSYWSVTTPSGILGFHMPAVMASQGRWAVFAAIAWVQGFLLQVPPMLQLPLSLLEWWVVSREFHLLEEGLGLGAPGWQQQLLEALIVVAVPLLLQHAVHRRPLGPAQPPAPQAAGGQQQDAEVSQPTASSSGRGVVKNLMPAPDGGTPDAAQGAGSPKHHATLPGQGHASRTEAGAADSGAVGPPDWSCCVSRDQLRDISTNTGTAGLSSSSGINQEHLGHSSQEAGSGALLTVPQLPGMPPGYAQTALMLQQLLPGCDWLAAAPAVDDTHNQGFLLPEHLRYTPCCCVVPVSIKVPTPPGMSYTTAAALVMAAASRQLACQAPGGLLVHAMATVPGCVLWLGELLAPAGQQQPAAAQQHRISPEQQGDRVWTAQDIILSLPALLRSGWLVPTAATPTPGSLPPSPAGAVAGAGTTSTAQGPAAVAEDMVEAHGAAAKLMFQGLPPGVIPAVQQGLQQALAGACDQPPSHSSSSGEEDQDQDAGASTGLAGVPSDRAASTPSAAPQAVAGPTTSCVVATWGQPVTLQLLEMAGGSSRHGAGTGSTCGRVETYRVVAMHQLQALMDEVVVVTSSSRGGNSSSACPSLTVTCMRSEGSQGPHTDVPAVVSLYLIPAATSQGATNNNSSSSSTDMAPPMNGWGPACLPVAHVMVVLLPPAPAAELSAWVATERLPISFVAAWGADLAVLVGSAGQLVAGRSAADAGTMERLMEVRHLAIATADSLAQLFSSAGLVAASDLVAVLKQQVLVRATALAPMAAGGVVPPAAAGAGATGAAARSVAETWLMPGPIEVLQAAASPAIRVTVSTSGEQHPGVAFVAQGQLWNALGASQQHLLKTPATATAAEAASTGVGAAAEGHGSSGCSEGSMQTAAPGEAAPGSSHAATALAAMGELSEGSKPSALKAQRQQSMPSALPVEPAESAALTGRWWRAVPLCWRGFRDAGTERSYQVFRAEVLWRWDLVARSYHLTVGLALTAKAFDSPQAKDALWGWAGLSVAVMLGELAAHVVLLLGAPSVWGHRRDALLAFFHLSAGLIWVWQVLAWTPSLFCVMYGSGARLLIVPVSLLLCPTSPKAALFSSAFLSPLAYTTLLLLSVRDPTDSAGLGVLQAGIRSSSGSLVWGGMAYSGINVTAVLLLGWAFEVTNRRAWLKKQRPQHQQQRQAMGCAPALECKEATAPGPSCSSC